MDDYEKHQFLTQAYDPVLRYLKEEKKLKEITFL